MRLRRLAPAAVLLLVPVLAACGDDGDTSSTDDPTTSSAPSTTASSPTPSDTPSATVTETTSEATVEPTTADRPQACELLTSDTVAKTIGVPFTAGKPGTGAVTEQGTTWTADRCTFSSAGLVDVRIEVSGPADVTAGKFGCLQPSDTDGNVEPSDVAGATQAWWKVSSAPPLVATLRACSRTVNVDVRMTYADGTDYPGDPSQQAPQLAGLVLASLQG